MANLPEQLTAADEMLRDSAAARYVGMSESWLRQTRMIGRTDGPPFIRIGTRAIRYRRRDLDLWLERRVCRAAGDACLEHATNGYPRNKLRKGPRRKRRRLRNRGSVGWR